MMFLLHILAMDQNLRTRGPQIGMSMYVSISHPSFVGTQFAPIAI